MPYLVTPEQLATIAGKATRLMPGLVEWIDTTCPACEVDTPQEYCHFLIQGCHETDDFGSRAQTSSTCRRWRSSASPSTAANNDMEERKKYYAIAPGVLTWPLSYARFSD